MDAGLHRDRLTGRASQAAHRAADDRVGVRPLLNTVEAGQVALQERGEPVLAAADLVRGHDGVGQEGLSVGVVQE